MIVGDPRAWLTNASYYTDDTSNPFKQAGYYHAMSAWRGAPGDLYGHRNRVSEQCTRWVASVGMHVKGLLIRDCISTDVPESCMSLCSVEAVATPPDPTL